MANPRVWTAFRAELWQDAGLRPSEAPLALPIDVENVPEEESQRKKKAQAGKLAPNLISNFRIANPEG
jgi:hypothetical protein